MTKEAYTKNRQGNTELNFRISHFLLILSFVLIFGMGQNIIAQGSTIESSPYKKKSKKVAKKPKKKVAKKKPKPASKKATPKKRVTKKTAPRRTKPKRRKARSTRKKSAPKRGPNMMKVVFNTEGPNQEIWRGNEKIGISDQNARLEKWMPKGNYLVSVRNSRGETVVNSQLVAIDGDQEVFELGGGRILDETNENEPTAEQRLNESEAKDTLDAAERINGILKRYGDPLKTNTVSLSDWEFVYQSAQANNLKGFTAIQIEAQRWFSTGQIELAKGNYANANRSFIKSAEYMPDSAYPFYGLGEAFNANRQYRDALNSYLRAIGIDYKFALAHRKIGDIQAASNKPKDAIESYETALTQGFDTPAVRFDLAKAYIETERWDDASRELERVVNEAPTGDVYETLGDLYGKLKRTISSYEAYKQATVLSPDSARAFNKLGKLLYDEREYERAKAAVERALELDQKGDQINITQAKKLVREAAQKIK